MRYAKYGRQYAGDRIEMTLIASHPSPEVPIPIGLSEGGEVEKKDGASFCVE
jgi:hypothetical protein